jgi:PmbA protein
MNPVPSANTSHDHRNGLSYGSDRLTELAAHVLELARRDGASACDVDISESMGQSVSVRMGEVETIEYNRDKGVGVTVYLGHRKGHASSSDFSAEALGETVAAALAIARHTAEDDCAGLADADRLATVFPDLDLYHPWDLSVEGAIALAMKCEQAARDVDTRICNSEGATLSSHVGHAVYANSNGFSGYNLSSRHSISCAVIAQQGDAMQRDYWYTSGRAPADLEDAAAVGTHAGQRTVARLGARRLKTGECRVLYDAALATGLVGHFVNAVSGGSLYRRSTFLLDSLGMPVFSPIVNIVEDPFLPRGMASGAFDAEGVATARRSLVSDGILHGYFLGSYSARKLGMHSTGNAGGSHNLLVKATSGGLDDMLRQLGTGLYVTELMGQGINGVTGDYSRGAAGFWVENGVIVHPVEEITIAGNLKQMFQSIVAIGADVETRGSKRIGSVLIDKMTVAGS